MLGAALHLLASRGTKGATVRAICAAAGVTPGLVVYHFGTKENLVAEVDEVVTERFTRAMSVPDDLDDGVVAMRAIASGLSELIGKDPDLRGYVRRSILEGTPTGVKVFTHLVELTADVLRRFGDSGNVPAGERSWWAVQVVMVNLAGVLLEPVLAQVDKTDPFSANRVIERTNSNLEFVARALGVAPVSPPPGARRQGDR